MTFYSFIKGLYSSTKSLAQTSVAYSSKLFSVPQKDARGIYTTNDLESRFLDKINVTDMNLSSKDLSNQASYFRDYLAPQVYNIGNINSGFKKYVVKRLEEKKQFLESMLEDSIKNHTQEIRTKGSSYEESQSLIDARNYKNALIELNRSIALIKDPLTEAAQVKSRQLQEIQKKTDDQSLMVYATQAPRPEVRPSPRTYAHPVSREDLEYEYAY